MSDPSLNPLHRPTKTRRLFSAWTVRREGEQQRAVIDRIREFADAFDEIVLMCGGLEPNGELPERWPLDERRRLADELHEMGISVILDWGGRYSEAMARSFREPALRQRHVEAMLRDVEAVGAEGVDIDIEGWPATMRNPYTSFMAELGEAVHHRDKSLSVCTFSLSREARRENGVGFIDPTLLLPFIDQFRCMTYDLYCPPSEFVGPTSTAPWGRETMGYMAERVPVDRIVMGLPTYSVDWNINDPTKSRQVNDAAFIAAREKQSPIGRGWCYYQDVSLIRYTDDAGHAHLLWVSDARSTRSHLVTVDSLDLSGVCFWVLTGDEDPAIWRAVRDHFQR